MIKKLKILNEDIHILHCPFCEITFDKNEIASWNILNRGIKKISSKNELRKMISEIDEDIIL